MVNLRTSPPPAAEMGQISSQVGPSGPSESAGKRDARLQNGKGKKKRKRRSADVVGEEDAEEGTARALMQLSADAVVNARQPSYDDDLAASAQLMAESSPMRPFKSREAEGYMEDQEGPAREKRSKDKKHKRDRSQMMPKVSDMGEGPSSNARRARDGLDLPGMSPPEIPRSTFSLDDIDSNDEAVASYLHEYESGVASHPSPTVSQIDTIEAQRLEQQTVMGTETSPRDDVVYSSYGVPSPPYTQQANDKKSRKRKSRTNRPAGDSEDENQGSLQGTSQLPGGVHDSTLLQTHKRKRKKDKTFALDNGYDEHQGLLNGSGQHVLDHDFAAFDQYIAENGMHSANLFDHDPGHTMPIDPQLIREGDLTESTRHDIVSNPDDDVAIQASRDGKLKRVPRHSKRARANGSSSNYISPYTNNEDWYPHVSAGTEGQQRQLSPEVGLSGLVDEDHINYSSPADGSRRRNSASKSDKCSKSFGTTTSRSDRGRSKHNPSMQEIVDKGGMFTNGEIAKLDTFRSDYCDESKISIWQFNELIHTRIRGNPKVTSLFQEIQEVLPYRKRAAVQRFCRRRYHNFSARGTWTKEEDERLKEAVAEKGKSWKAVGEVVERLPEDCRDRWRNYLINGDNRNTDTWTDAEVKNLITAVRDCIRVMRQARREEKEQKYAGRDLPDSEPDTDEEAEEVKLINWQAVSNRMGANGGGRSRLQCSHKYGKLKLADRRAYMRQIREAGENMRRLEQGRPLKKSTTSNEGWRYRKAMKRIKNMKAGDRYDLLQVLSACKAPEEGGIPWKHLGDDGFRARWSRLERMAAWESMKKEVRGSETMDYDDVVNRLLTKMMAENVEHLDERWDPEVDEDVNEEGNFKKLSRKQERQNKSTKAEKARRREERVAAAQPKSALFISPNDEEDLDMDDTSRQHSEVAENDDGYEIRESSRVPTATDTGDEQQDLHEGSISEDAEQPQSEEEVQGNDSEDFNGESQLGDGDASDDLGDRMQMLRDV